MKRVLLVGPVACGKTTLCQRFNGLEQSYHKTQTIQVTGTTIDTPGEYMEHRSLLRNLMLLATDAEKVFLLIDPTREQFMYSPGLATGFPVPVAGLVSKVDMADQDQIQKARELLEITGADPIFEISSVTGEGMEELLDYLS